MPEVMVGSECPPSLRRCSDAHTGLRSTNSLSALGAQLPADGTATATPEHPSDEQTLSIPYSMSGADLHDLCRSHDASG